MTHTRTIERALRLAAVAVTVTLGCQGLLGIQDGSPQRDKCKLNSDCTGGNVCLFETCSRPCAADADCAKGDRCLTTKTEAGTACVSPEQVSCDATKVCADGTICIDGQCRSDCGVGLSACRVDQICSAGACVGTSAGHDMGLMPAHDGGAGGATTGAGGAGGTMSGGAGGAGAGNGGAPDGSVGAGGSADGGVDGGPGTGGSRGAGGSSGTGGNLGAGGNPASGGTPNAGGSLGAGGNIGSGGAQSAGGAPGAGAAPGTGGATGGGGSGIVLQLGGIGSLGPSTAPAGNVVLTRQSLWAPGALVCNATTCVYGRIAE